MTIDEQGMAVPWYEMTDPVDLRNTAHALEVQIRAHVAAGARRVWLLAQRAPEWRVGDDLDAFIARVQRIPARAGGLRMFAAHQMGSCRMGRDPQTQRRQAHAASCTTRPGCGSATPRRSPRPRAPTR